MIADPDLLKKIDGLFATGVGDLINLPQLIVVGDQSSGKSSVLEGLARLPFPRDSGLCTRFATHITFRRSPEESVDISIRPGQDASTEHAKKVKGWRRSDVTTLDRPTFARIMTEVHDVMGLQGKESAGNLPAFSNDTLRIEVCGPTQEHFSVIDVPGIFRVCTEGVTTDADKAAVLAMVQQYMANPRSIILAVVPANVDIATQEILTMARKADPAGTRTVGVLTKPDLVDQGAEKGVIDLLLGKRQKLVLGWCIVRNLGQKELESQADRDALEEKFFSTRPPWTSLNKEQVGVPALRERLQAVLSSVITAEFPKVKLDINRKLAAARESLRALGPTRDSSTEQREYLLDMSMRYQEFVNAAIKANYADNDWFDAHPSLRFATRVVDRHTRFTDMMRDYGHSYAFSIDDSELSPLTLPQRENSISLQSDDSVNSAVSDSIPVREIEIEEPGDLDITFEARPLPATSDQSIKVWLTEMYEGSRGFELGTFDSHLLSIAMKNQSSNWEQIALGCVEDMVCLVHQFIVKLLELICPDQRMRRGVMSALSDTLHCRYRDAIEHVRFLLYVERTGIPSTQNHYFSDNLQKSRHSRAQQSVLEKNLSGAINECKRVIDILRTRNMSNVEHVVEELQDILASYYKVALKRFTDNVCMQGTGHHLATGPDSPLRIFSPKFVNTLPEAQLKEIAGEEPMMQKRRARLVREISVFEAGKKLL